jgi:phosphate transport system protein
MNCCCSAACLLMRFIRQSRPCRRWIHDKARKIIEADAAINRKRFQIEDTCLTLIATQQPMARDMRLLAAILEIAGELERIGDYGKGIGRIIIYMNGNSPIKKLIDIPKMETLAHTMLDKAMTAFVNGDVELAKSVPPLDDQVDALYNQVNRDLLEPAPNAA